MIEWSYNDFSRHYAGVKVRNGEQLAEMLRTLGHDVIAVDETSATINALVGGVEMSITIATGDEPITAKPLYDTGVAANS
jgi:hypothetical protein